jgi:hypothetical protein
MQTTDSSRDVLSHVTHRIHSRTHGRIRDLHVEFDGSGTVVLRGRASTYYAKQLAQHGALEALAGETVVNAIDVG